MEIMKNFKPQPIEEGDEFYPNGIFVFNISKLIDYISKNPDIFIAEKIQPSSIPSFATNTLDESTIKSANLTNPIIMAEISPGQFSVIDGHHRLEKAKRNNVEYIYAFKVPVKYHIHFLTSTKGYHAYVEYWNDKLKDQRNGLI